VTDEAVLADSESEFNEGRFYDEYGKTQKPATIGDYSWYTLHQQKGQSYH
jgi:hypothetical protein